MSCAPQLLHLLAELAIAWLISRPWVSSVIASVTSVEQLSHNTAASSWKLTSEDISELDKIRVSPRFPGSPKNPIVSCDEPNLNWEADVLPNIQNCTDPGVTWDDASSVTVLG